MSGVIRAFRYLRFAGVA